MNEILEQHTMVYLHKNNKVMYIMFYPLPQGGGKALCYVEVMNVEKIF